MATELEELLAAGDGELDIASILQAGDSGFASKKPASILDAIKAADSFTGGTQLVDTGVPALNALLLAGRQKSRDAAVLPLLEMMKQSRSEAAKGRLQNLLLKEAIKGKRSEKEIGLRQGAISSRQDKALAASKFEGEANRGIRREGQVIQREGLTSQEKNQAANRALQEALQTGRFAHETGLQGTRLGQQKEQFESELGLKREQLSSRESSDREGRALQRELQTQRLNQQADLFSRGNEFSREKIISQGIVDGDLRNMNPELVEKAIQNPQLYNELLQKGQVLKSVTPEIGGYMASMEDAADKYAKELGIANDLTPDETRRSYERTALLRMEEAGMDAEFIKDAKAAQATGKTLSEFFKEQNSVQLPSFLSTIIPGALAFSNLDSDEVTSGMKILGEVMSEAGAEVDVARLEILEADFLNERKRAVAAAGKAGVNIEDAVRTQSARVNPSTDISLRPRTKEESGEALFNRIKLGRARPVEQEALQLNR